MYFFKTKYILKIWILKIYIYYSSTIKEENDLNLNTNKKIKGLKNYKPFLEMKENIFFDKNSFYSDKNITIKRNNNNNFNENKEIKEIKKKMKKKYFFWK